MGSGTTNTPRRCSSSRMGAAASRALLTCRRQVTAMEASWRYQLRLPKGCSPCACSSRNEGGGPCLQGPSDSHGGKLHTKRAAFAHAVRLPFVVQGTSALA